ncbi:hypothetical protein ACOMHN_034038 [Nucella lapillus]
MLGKQLDDCFRGVCSSFKRIKDIVLQMKQEPEASDNCTNINHLLQERNDLSRLDQMEKKNVDRLETTLRQSNLKINQRTSRSNGAIPNVKNDHNHPANQRTSRSNGAIPNVKNDHNHPANQRTSRSNGAIPNVKNDHNHPANQRTSRSNGTIPNVKNDHNHPANQRTSRSNGAIPNVKNYHNHLANQRCQEETSIAEMKEGAAATDAPTRRLIGEMRANLTDETLTNLPQRSALRRTIQRKRKIDDAFPPLPLNLEDIDILEQFREVLVGGTQVRFLLDDTGDADNDAEEEENLLKRIIFFGTDEVLRFMTANSNWMADGTFKVAPQLFFQLYTIHVIKDNHVIPCLCQDDPEQYTSKGRKLP